MPPPPTERQIVDHVVSTIGKLVPADWALAVEREPPASGRQRPDVVLHITAPDSAQATFVGEVKREASARQIHEALAQLHAYLEFVEGARPLIIAPWLSARLRETLGAQNVSHADATGNVRLQADHPGLLLTASGADRNPWPTDKSLQSLRGTGAMRAVRALLDHAPPYGVRELAGRTNASAATLSRVIDLLERDGLAERDPKGAVADLDWIGTIRRWTQDYDVLSTNTAASYLQPRGVDALTDRLRAAPARYAVTGSLAAQAFAPIAPTRLAMVYVEGPSNVADALDLRPVDGGGNAILLEPYDDVVFERTVDRNGLALVNPAQLAVDLLTGPGRSPSEGEELLAWMKDHTDVWRA